MDDTVVISKQPAEAAPKLKAESSAFGVSVRAWLALLTTGTVCGMVLQAKPIDANFIAQWGMILAFYYAQKETPKQ